MAFDFSDISLEMLEDNIWTEVVSSSILVRARECAKTLDWTRIPEEQNILPPELRDFITEDSGGVAQSSPAKRMKLEPLDDITNQFGNSVTGGDTLATFSKGFVPENTKMNTQWAVRAFQSWSSWRNGVHPDDPVPSDILGSGDASTLNKWLSLFVIEAKKQDGSKYPSKTIDLLLCGLRRHMKEVNPVAPNFLNEQDDRFAGLRGTRDTVARRLREEGIGAVVNHTETLSYEEEASLWDRGLLGIASPKSLFNAMFFMNGKVLCLRGSREHKGLKISQFTFGREGDREFVVYTENGSKNRSGSYKDKAGNKIIKHFCDRSLGERCYVNILKTYLGKLAPKIKEMESPDFYWKPKDKTPLAKDACWFTMQPCGRNFLGGVVKSVCEEVGVYGKTNHSLRATGTTRLFAANVPEKLIAERTGHRSTDALRMYERTSVKQQETVSSIIASSSPKEFTMSSTASGSCQSQAIERSGRAEDSKKVTFDNCQNCTINVNVTYGGGIS